jgi:mxaJ protein
MSSRCHDFVALALCAAFAAQADARTLRVCADPDNLPFSHQYGIGFENRIAELVARSMRAELHYYWWPQRRGFLRNTLDAGVCDVVIGVPARMDAVRTTRAYYRSTYVFVQHDDTPRIVALDDARLRTLTIGLVLPGDDGAATPPAEALAARGIVDNVRGYTPFGEPSAAERIVDDVAQRRVGIGILWGPQAGFFARRDGRNLAVAPIQVDATRPLPIEFDIAMGVRRTDEHLQAELDAVLAREEEAIHAVLRDFAVPRVPPGAAQEDVR